MADEKKPTALGRLFKENGVTAALLVVLGALLAPHIPLLQEDTKLDATHMSSTAAVESIPDGVYEFKGGKRVLAGHEHLDQLFHLDCKGCKQSFEGYHLHLHREAVVEAQKKRRPLGPPPAPEASVAPVRS